MLMLASCIALKVRRRSFIWSAMSEASIVALLMPGLTKITVLRPLGQPLRISAMLRSAVDTHFPSGHAPDRPDLGFGATVIGSDCRLRSLAANGFRGESP